MSEHSDNPSVSFELLAETTDFRAYIRKNGAANERETLGWFQAMHDEGWELVLTDRRAPPPAYLFRRRSTRIDARHESPRHQYELSVRGGELGWHEIGKRCSVGRRSLWLRITMSDADGKPVAFELCAGREGDDAYVRIEASHPKFVELLETLLTGKFAAET